MNPSTAFAATLVDELMRCGLREAVLAPGSRSAPLALALFDRAGEAGTALRLHVRIDERSAAFLALGLAKASGRPVAAICTSGTAAANFLPAVIEADESGVPLLVLTADRPPELRGTGANQAIDQLKLYGGAVRWFAEAGVPEARPGMNAYWRSLACRAWAAGSGADGGFPGAGAPEPAAARSAGAGPAGRSGRHRDAVPGPERRRCGRLAGAAGRAARRRPVDPVGRAGPAGTARPGRATRPPAPRLRRARDAGPALDRAGSHRGRGRRR